MNWIVQLDRYIQAQVNETTSQLLSKVAFALNYSLRLQNPCT